MIFPLKNTLQTQTTLSQRAHKPLMSISLFSLFLGLSLPAQANEHLAKNAADLSPIEEEILWLKEETYVTTATKTLEDIKKSGATVSIITEQDLQNMGARNLMDALKRIPGLGITINNIGLPVIEVRGVKTEYSEKVLFLKNGHSINNNIVNGGATWSHNNFLIDDIKRVEIVRGPGSALYGANAFVAVINIITKTTEDIDGSQVSLSLGDNATKKVNIQTGQKINDIDVAFNATLFDTDGHRELVDSDLWGHTGHTDDRDKQLAFGLNLNYSNFSFQGQYLKRNAGPYVGFGNALNDESEQSYIEYFLELSYQRALTENLQFSQNGYYNNFKSDNYWEVHPEGFPSPSHTDGMIGTSPLTAETFGTEIQLEYMIHQHKIVVGIMAERQSIFDIGFETNFNPSVPSADPLLGGVQDVYDRWPWIPKQQRDIQAAYLQDIWDIHQSLRLIVGARYDYYSDVGGSFNPRSSLSWEFIEDSRLLFSYGTAFRAPNFGELYNANNPGALGNPNLNPEEIETYELSIDTAFNKRTNARATLFRNEISDVIDFRNIVASNLGKLEINGLEIEFNSRLRDGSNLTLNYTYQYTVDRENDRRVAEVPMHKANASYNYRHSQFFNSYLGLNYIGKVNRDSTDTRTELSEHITVDAAFNLTSPNKNTNINISIYNLFNEKYADASHINAVGSDFPKPGRNFMLEVSQKL